MMKLSEFTKKYPSAEREVFVLYHGNCYDGYGAAWAAHKFWGNDAKYIEVFYGQKVPEIPEGAIVYVLDFSFPREVLEELSNKAIVMVLDHHATAERALAGLPRIGADSTLQVLFDMKRSGALITWDYFEKGVEAPPLIRYISDRDLWTKQLAGSEEVYSYMRSIPKTFESYNALNAELAHDLDSVIKAGAAINRCRQNDITMIMGQRFIQNIRGVNAVLVNATSEWSDVGNQLLAIESNVRISLSFYRTKDGRYKWSARSRGDFDVSKFCEQFGGGGHPAAAGFTTNTLEEVIA